jgi:hypothetical protein
MGFLRLDYLTISTLPYSKINHIRTHKEEKKNKHVILKKQFHC